MDIALMICSCLFYINVLLGVGMLLNRKKFLSAPPFDRQAFRRCLDIPCDICVIEILTSIPTFFLIIIVTGLENEIIGKVVYLFFALMVGGFVVGYIIGLIYWYKIKKKFFVTTFPKEYKEYIEAVHKHYSRTRVEWYKSSTVHNFALPLYSLGALIGIMIGAFL